MEKIVDKILVIFFTDTNLHKGNQKKNCSGKKRLEGYIFEQ